MVLKLGKIAIYLCLVSLAFAQGTSSYVQSDSFHINSCATPCVAELALTQTPTGSVTLYDDGVLLTPDLYTIDTSNGPSEIVVSFSASVGTIQASDLIVATYPTAQPPAGQSPATPPPSGPVSPQ
jgi:hypothetical protein